MVRAFGNLKFWARTAFGIVTTGTCSAVAVVWSARNQAVIAQQSNSCTSGMCGENATKWNYSWDKRDPETLMKNDVSRLADSDSEPKKGCGCCEDGDGADGDLEKYTAKCDRHLILIRHGNYNADASTDSCQNLSDLGVLQAVLTGKRLASYGVKFSAIISSSLTRAVETAEIMLKTVNEAVNQVEQCNCPNHRQIANDVVVVDSLLDDGTPCQPEPMDLVCERETSPDSKNYVDCPRIEAAFRKYVHRAEPSETEDTTEIIVCHNNVITYFVCRALQLPPEGWSRMLVNHGSITSITIRANGMVFCRFLGDTGHIPANQITNE